MTNLTSAELLAAMAAASTKTATKKKEPTYNKTAWANECQLALVQWAGAAATEHELEARIALITGQFCSQHLPERKAGYEVGARAVFTAARGDS